MAHVSPIDTRSGPRTVSFGAVALTALVGAATFLIWQILVTELVLGHSPWATLRMMASIVLGEDVTRIALTFDLGIIATGLLVHYVLSFIYSLVIALLVARLQMRTAVLVGIAFGAALYFVNLYGFAAAVFPWFERAQSWITLLGHLIFGAVLAYWYKLTRRDAMRPASAP